MVYTARHSSFFTQPSISSCKLDSFTLPRGPRTHTQSNPSPHIVPYILNAGGSTLDSNSDQTIRNTHILSNRKVEPTCTGTGKLLKSSHLKRREQIASQPTKPLGKLSTAKALTVTGCTCSALWRRHEALGTARSTRIEFLAPIYRFALDP